MEFEVLKTKDDYERALQRLEVIFNAKKGSKEGEELESLGLLIMQYEDEHFPIGLPDKSKQ